MLNIDKQNQLISSLKEIHKKNENYILQNNFLLYLKPSNINKKKDNLLIDLYDKENCISNLPPHIYDIAKTALIRTLVLNKDVSIIFNGNSQSGKTYNIYKCLEYFSMTSFNKNKNFNCNVIDSINVMIENLCCIDSITEIPILYKINVSLNGISGIEFNRILSNGYNKLICFNKNTKNFNIFYTVFYGIEENKKEKFGLQNKKFFLLNDIILNAEEKEYCKNQFNKLKYSMIEVLGFTEEHYKTFVQIICAILNIGNISFYIDTNSDDQIVKICQKPELLIISELLEIPNTELFNIFNYKNYDNSIEKALYLRDQLIEMLYIKLIDWVLMRIQNIYDNKSNSSIYIFDYKGYTSSGYNEYDEFCTNITNEIHMNLFLSKYMEYYLNNNKIEENIILTKKINESCLNLLINGKENLLGTLNDECVFPLTSTSTLIKKFDLNFIDQNCYLNSRTKKSLEFGIKHFFGVQYYNVTDFLLQNKRMTNKSSDEIFLKSQNSTIISMFSGKNCSYEERTCNKFVATEIVNSLNKNVISKLLLTEMLFICCLKPSLKKNSEDFDSNLMTKQLKSQGLLDLLKIETNNFNHHYYISQFLKIFNILLPINCTEKCNDVQNVQNIFNKQHNKFRNDYIILDKKVYLTEYLAKNLEWKKYDHTLKCIIKIQTLFRRQIERKNFLLKKKAAIKIQSLFRGWKGRQIVSILRTQIKEKMITENVTQNNGICKYLIKSISTNIPSQIVEENINLNLEFENNYVKISNTQDVLPILQIPIENFAKKYIKYHQLGVKREAIFSPFLEKDNENDYSKSLKLFKLILEYMLSESDDNLLIKNITETVINNTKLKDEIYIQILNQTYNNSSKKEKNKIWILFFVILNSFLPSNNLFPVLIDYFIIQKQPIQILFNETFYRHLSISQQQSYCRRYPSITTYEMITFTKKYPLCIKINISKMCILSIQIDSLSTIKEIIKNCLEKININNVNGWNINMEVLKNKLLIKLEEKDYYFDIIYMIENDMINNIKEEKITYPTNIKRLKNNKKESSTLGTQLENEKNKIIKNKKTNDGNVKQTDKINDLILSPKTLRRIFILNSNELTENPENEDKKISDNNNNSSINQLKIYDKNYSSNIDENGNNIECFNIPTKDIEKNIYSLPKYMPIMEVDDDVQDMIDDIFYDSISENKDTNLIKSSIEKKLIKNIQGGLLKENSNEKCTYVPYKEQYKDIYDLETSSSLNTMSSSKMSSNCDKNYNNTNSKMAVNKMELQKLINLEEIESSTCGNDNISKTINYLKSKDAIIIPLNLYNITLRKEIFYPYEILDKYEIDLIYLQIINDCKENNPYCIEKKERDSINKILRYNKISLHDINEPEKLPYKTKEEIVNCARGWPLYFSKVYFVTKIKDNIFQKCQLHISENGIYVVEVQLNFETNPYIITDKIFYDEISDTYFEDENNFYIYLYNNTHLKFSTQKKSEEIQGIINKFLNPILEKPIYLHTIAPFLSNNSELLSFDKGDQIQIINDNYYHKSTIPNYGNGWLFGKCHNSVGWFSTDYVSMTPTEDSSYVTPYFDYQQKKELVVMGSHTIQHNIKIVEHPPSDYNNTEFKKPEIISQPSNNDDYYFTKNKNGLKKRSNSYERNDFPSRHDNYFHSRDNSQNFNQHRENYYHDRKLFPSQFSTLPRRVTSTGIPGPNPDYYPTKNFYDKGEFNSSYDVRNSHYQSQPLKSKDYSPKRHFDDFGFTESYNQNKDYGSYGRETGNVEESYDKQIKMSRSMSAIPTNGMRYRDNAYYYPQTDYSPLNSRIIRPFNRKFIEDGRTFNSNRQQSGPLPNYQYSNSGVGGGGQHYHSNSRYDNYHESFYGTKNNEQMKYDQQSLPYGSPNMMVTSQHDRNKQLSSKSAKIGSRHSKSQSIKRQNRWTSSGTAANSGYFDKNAIIGYDKDGKPIRRQNHYKVNCCCFTFKWPLWTVEPCPPPQRMYGPSNFEHNQNMNVHENFKDNNFDDNDVIYESNIETYSMAEFAINFFQKQKRGTEIGTLFRKKDKDWTWKDISNLIKYSSKPITSSLLLLNSNELQKGSVDTFMCIMRYMGDENLKKNQTITDCVYELLTICKENPPLHDEVYCQMMKQLTSNTSKIEDSLLKGWRLFTIITSYFTTSDILKPYLINFLKLIAFDKNRSCHQTAMTCLKNFEQTLKYGGRKLLLSASEVEAITKGKYVKRQAYLLPGGHKMFINTTISTVAENLIKHICCEMNIFSLKEQQEFSLCYLIENENNMEIISNNEYILDITTKMTLEKKKIMLVLKRFVWISPLRFDNNLLIDVMFYQILPDYISGLYMTNCDKKSLTIKDLNSLSLMGALIHYSDSIGKATTVKSDCIDSLIPSIILKKYSKITLNDWANRIMKKINEWNFEMTTIYAKSLFLITLQKYYLFSGTFYHIKKVIKNGTSINELIDGILAINKNGLTFLDKENRNIIFKINFDEIDFTDFYPQDYKLSIITTLNNMITLMADAGDDITKIIHHYMYIYKF